MTRHDASPTTYDLVPYESLPYPQTHPDRLATVAGLFGMRPKPVERARVLELGCAGGGNLIPMAMELPGASFLGVDLSARQIDDGRALAQKVGTPNVELRRANVSDVGEDDGPFDFIICHGVYSWVPRAVQDGILEVCARTLSPQGVAYVSYNTYPGWHMREAIRDMMLYHSDRFEDPATRIAQARALLDFLASSVSVKDGPYEQILKKELEVLRDKRDSYLFHEHLEEHNQALYFHQFVERAAGEGLQYLGEAQVAAMAARSFPKQVQETLARVSSDLVQAEQYMDFLRNRMFRQTLLCRADASLSRALGPERLFGLHVGSSVKPAEPGPEQDGGRRFESPDGSSVTTRDPLTASALGALSRAWPTWVPFDELLDEARAEVHGPDERGVERDQDARNLGDRLLTLYLSTTFLELHTIPPAFTRTPSELPRATPLARAQSESARRVTNLRHETVELSDLQRYVMRLLDGTRDRASLVAELRGAFDRGELTLSGAGADAGADRSANGAGPGEDAISWALDAVLARLARGALLRA